MHGIRRLGRRSARCRLFVGIDSSGVALGWVSVALIATIGLVGMAFDLGILHIAAQRCQDIADSAALGAAAELPAADAVRSTALGIVDSNNMDGHGWQVTCDESDIVLYGPGSTVGNTTLDSNANAVEVTVRSPVEFHFIRVLGLESTIARRRAIAMRGISDGVLLTPMWINHEIAEEVWTSGKRHQILEYNESLAEDIPGSYGYLASPDGSTADEIDLLQGYDLSEEDVATSQVSIGDEIYAKTGERSGIIQRAFSHDPPDRNSRIERGSTGIYEGDTHEKYTSGNPRLMLVPLVSHVTGTGDNALFRIEGLAVFWLEDFVDGEDKDEIHAYFVDFYIPGDDTFGTPTFDGFFSVKLIV